MDEHQHDAEEQVEDLEMQDKDAEDVKGGFSWSEHQTATANVKADGSVRNVTPENLRGLDGQGGLNHNETLVRV